ncbi:hypothetical protein ITJ54_02725 [Curtobacterium sp. VKM Ac-2865]|uniref:hypothetical protein n=1 Tax=Curtobacterium sp. VKM Ac-2865 TaxID=2783817 RepID=UPI00188B7EA1|nr:hypothetical protein [Curtobacterium sp. VKM Ac-2865]MBF4581575.1 hypothetical protein [Curtobacterium sp. VKM Ac-2865]
MPPTRLQRSGATLDDVRDAVRAEFGAGARIIAAERVTSGGVGGLFRRAHVEATVEVLDPDEVPTVRVAIADGPATRVGIAALLADADEAEARIASGDGTLAARADVFASVLDGFVADGIALPAPAAAAPTVPVLTTGPVPVAAPDPGPFVTDPVSGSRPPQEVAPSLLAGPTGGAAPVHDLTTRRGRRALAAGRPPVPPVLSGDGDLVLLVGRGVDVDAARAAFAARHDLRETDALDRRGGILARADGVRAGHALLGGVAWDDHAALEGLAPDQVWVVVDAGRKHEDSLLMVHAVALVVPVAGVLAVGTRETTTPDSVHELGLPVRPR